MHTGKLADEENGGVGVVDVLVAHVETTDGLTHCEGAPRKIGSFLTTLHGENGIVTLLFHLGGR